MVESDLFAGFIFNHLNRCTALLHVCSGPGSAWEDTHTENRKGKGCRLPRCWACIDVEPKAILAVLSLSKLLLSPKQLFKGQLQVERSWSSMPACFRSALGLSQLLQLCICFCWDFVRLEPNGAWSPRRQESKVLAGHTTRPSSFCSVNAWHRPCCGRVDWPATLTPQLPSAPFPNPHNKMAGEKLLMTKTLRRTFGSVHVYM